MLNDYLVAPCSLTGCPDIINIFCFDIFHTSLFYGFWPTVCQGLAWAYEYMRKSKWDIHTWEFHPSSPAGMQHCCSRRTGKILMEKKSRISCGNYIVQFSSKSEGLGCSSWLQYVLPNDVCSSQSSILKVKLKFFDTF